MYIELCALDAVHFCCFACYSSSAKIRILICKTNASSPWLQCVLLMTCRQYLALRMRLEILAMVTCPQTWWGRHQQVIVTCAHAFANSWFFVFTKNTRHVRSQWGCSQCPQNILWAVLTDYERYEEVYCLLSIQYNTIYKLPPCRLDFDAQLLFHTLRGRSRGSAC